MVLPYPNSVQVSWMEQPSQDPRREARQEVRTRQGLARIHTGRLARDRGGMIARDLARRRARDHNRERTRTLAERLARKYG